MSLSSKSARAATVRTGLAFFRALLFPIHAYSLESTANPIGATTVAQTDSFKSSTAAIESGQQPTVEAQQPSSSAHDAANQYQTTDSPTVNEASQRQGTDSLRAK